MDPTALESVQFGEEIQRLMAVPLENASSFTALLELPVTQAIELLHSPDTVDSSAPSSGGDDLKPYLHSFNGNLTFPSNMALIERAAKFSVFAAENNSSEASLGQSNLIPNLEVVKNEPMETDSNPTVEKKDQRLLAKRKQPEKKGKLSTKKSKNDFSDDTEKLPYVHVRARRGQATDSHSLAERARREKINARMKLLQELVPGCNKISGTALMLDEIINHVQSLQRQVEILSMRLSAVNPGLDFDLENMLPAEFLSMGVGAINPRTDFNLENVLAAQSGSIMDGNFPTMVVPPRRPEFQLNGNIEQYEQQWNFGRIQQPLWGTEEDNHNLFTMENSALSYDSTANAASLHSNQLKMKL